MTPAQIRALVRRDAAKTRRIEELNGYLTRLVAVVGGRRPVRAACYVIRDAIRALRQADDTEAIEIAGELERWLERKRCNR